MVEIIEVNADGDYKIKYNGKIIRKYGVIEIYKYGVTLKGILNPNIIEEINDIDTIHIEYEEPVISFDQLKSNKLSELRSKLDSSFEYDNQIFDVADIMRFTLVMVGNDTDIESELPISTDGIYIIDTVKKVKDLKKEYLKHSKLYGKMITDCMKATTKAEIEAIKI